MGRGVLYVEGSREGMQRVSCRVGVGLDSGQMEGERVRIAERVRNEEPGLGG